MKIRAGWMLCGRKPRHIPIRIAAEQRGGRGRLDAVAVPDAVRVHEERDATAMQTMPAARPSRPSTKLTALMVITTSATVSSVDWIGVRATVPIPGTGSHRMVRPWRTITPAAIICTPSLIRASTPHLSSRTPSSQISPAPDEQRPRLVGQRRRRPRGWSDARRPAGPRTARRTSRCRRAAASAPGARRARIGGIAPAAMANLRTGPVSRYVTAAETHRVSRYSRTSSLRRFRGRICSAHVGGPHSVTP